MNLSRPSESFWSLYIPKLFVVLKQGYGRTDFRDDVVAGLTVAIIALPLAMALAIASGTTPDKGLITVVIAGLLISLLGGSRVQIGGPTGAFVVVVFAIIAKHGYDGLVVATLMAGGILMLAGLLRLGTWIKYVPQPVVTGFTSGIAVIIFASQIKDIFGLKLETVPGEFIEKIAAFWAVRDTMDPVNLAMAAGCLAMIVGLRRYAPKLPAFLIVILAGSMVTYLLQLDLTTIGSAFGGIPRTLPAPHIPEGLSLGMMRELLPSALTIAFLAGIESLLSAVVADGMTGYRHRSNCELVAQGVANSASALFGGLPATGAIARTATNIRAGAKSPIAGILHAVFVLAFMMLFAPLASYIPLAALTAVLVIVAWNMAEAHRFMHLMQASRGETAILLLTFFLTVLVDLTVAIEVGVVLAAILFMVRMSEIVELQTHVPLIEGDAPDGPPRDPSTTMRARLPDGVEAFQIRGPLFFGMSSRLLDMLDNLVSKPKVFILRMSLVPMIDSSGITALEEFIRRCHKMNIQVILSGVQPEPFKIMKKMGLTAPDSGIAFATDFQHGLDIAEQFL